MAPRRDAQTREHASRRQFDRQARPALMLPEALSLDEVASAVQKRIRRALHDRGVGSVVACDPDGAVYILPAGDPRTDRAFVEHPGWIVGTYAEVPAGGGNASVPAVDVLLGDLECHIAEIGAPGPAAPVWWLLRPEDQLPLEFPPLNELAEAA